MKKLLYDLLYPLIIGSASTVSAAEGSKSASLPGSKLAVKRINIATLAPEDAVRRLRRRERNKVAATKCRNKKKARTSCLMKVSFFRVSFKNYVDKLMWQRDYFNYMSIGGGYVLMR